MRLWKVTPVKLPSPLRSTSAKYLMVEQSERRLTFIGQSCVLQRPSVASTFCRYRLNLVSSRMERCALNAKRRSSTRGVELILASAGFTGSLDDYTAYLSSSAPYSVAAAIISICRWRLHCSLATGARTGRRRHARTVRSTSPPPLAGHYDATVGNVNVNGDRPLALPNRFLRFEAWRRDRTQSGRWLAPLGLTCVFQRQCAWSTLVRALQARAVSSFVIGRCFHYQRAGGPLVAQ